MPPQGETGFFVEPVTPANLNAWLPIGSLGPVSFLKERWLFEQDASDFIVIRGRNRGLSVSLHSTTHLNQWPNAVLCSKSLPSHAHRELHVTCEHSTADYAIAGT